MKKGLEFQVPFFVLIIKCYLFIIHDVNKSMQGI